MARLTMTKEVTQTEIVLAKMRRKDGKSYAEDLPNEILIGNVSFGKAQERMKEKYGEGTVVYMAKEGSLLGCITISDALKEDAFSSISEIKKLGVTPIMLTGDNRKSAEAVAEKAGISKVYAGLLPQDKLSIMKDLRRKEGSVLFVGDGINDAPVLSASDCGIAMGFGSEAAIEASDAVLASGTLKQLPKAIKIARSVINTVKGNIIFALSIKALVIILAAFGLAQIWMSVIADTGVSVVCVLIAARLLKKKY